MVILHGAFCLLEPHAALSDDAVLWVSWQKLTFGKDIGISSILGYKKQLFSRGPRLCQMILSCVCSQTPKRSASTREIGVQRKEHLNLLVSKLWQTLVRAGAFFTSPQMDRKDRTSAEEAPSEWIHKYRRPFCLNIMRVYRKSSLINLRQCVRVTHYLPEGIHEKTRYRLNITNNTIACPPHPTPHLRKYESNSYGACGFKREHESSALLTSGQCRNIQHETFWLDSQSPRKSSECPRTVEVWVSSKASPLFLTNRRTRMEMTGLRTQKPTLYPVSNRFFLFPQESLYANGDKTEPHVRLWSPAKRSGVGCTANVGMRTPFSSSLLPPFLQSVDHPETGSSLFVFLKKKDHAASVLPSNLTCTTRYPLKLTLYI